MAHENVKGFYHAFAFNAMPVIGVWWSDTWMFHLGKPEYSTNPVDEARKEWNERNGEKKLYVFYVYDCMYTWKQRYESQQGAFSLRMKNDE